MFNATTTCTNYIKQVADDSLWVFKWDWYDPGSGNVPTPYIQRKEAGPLSTFQYTENIQPTYQECITEVQGLEWMLLPTITIIFILVATIIAGIINIKKS